MCGDVATYQYSSSQLGSQHRGGVVYGMKCTRVIGLNKALPCHHTLMDVFKYSVLLNSPLLCEHGVTGSEGHTPHIPVAFPSSLFMCGFGWPSEDLLKLTPIQSKITLFSGTTLYVTAMLPQIILESSTRHMTSRDKCWRNSSQSP